MCTIYNLGISKPRSLKAFWSLLEHQHLNTTVDLNVVVNYIAYLSMRVNIPVHEIYKTLYRKGGFDFQDKLDTESYLRCLSRTKQLHKFVVLLMDAYPYSWAKQKSSKRVT